MRRKKQCRIEMCKIRRVYIHEKRVNFCEFLALPIRLRYRFFIQLLSSANVTVLSSLFFSLSVSFSIHSLPFYTLTHIVCVCSQTVSSTTFRSANYVNCLFSFWFWCVSLSVWSLLLLGIGRLCLCVWCRRVLCAWASRIMSLRTEYRESSSIVVMAIDTDRKRMRCEADTHRDERYA